MDVKRYTLKHKFLNRDPTKCQKLYVADTNNDRESVNCSEIMTILRDNILAHGIRAENPCQNSPFLVGTKFKIYEKSDSEYLIMLEKGLSKDYWGYTIKYL